MTVPAADLHRSGGKVSLDFQPNPGRAGIGRQAAKTSVWVRIPADARGTLELWSSQHLGTRLDFSGVRAD